MENLHQFGFFLNEKKSYKDLFPDEIAMVSGIIEILKQVKDPRTEKR